MHTLDELLDSMWNITIMSIVVIRCSSPSRKCGKPPLGITLRRSKYARICRIDGLGIKTFEYPAVSTVIMLRIRK